MTIRPARVDDIPAIHGVRMRVRENTIPSIDVLDPRDSKRIIADGGAWVAEVDGRVVGFAMADVPETNVYALFVDPDFDRRGLGRRLHDVMMDWFFERDVPRVWLGTEPRTRAEGFYRRAGWTEAGRRENGEIRFEMMRARWRAMRGEDAG